MMNRFFILVIALMPGFMAMAQVKPEQLLQQVDTNNLTLKAFRQKLYADGLAARIGLTPANPEFEVIYQWGNPVDLGNKTTISLTQRFDFPTAYIHRSKLAKRQNQILALDFRINRAKTLNQAHLLYVDLVFTNALIAELKQQCTNSRNIANALSQKYQLGEIGIIPLTQVQLAYEEVNARLFEAITERDHIAQELTALNGGNKISITDSVLVIPSLPSTFDEWYSNALIRNPEISLLKGQVEQSLLQVKLTRSESLPTFNAGYASEKLAGERFQGVVAGITIPLWEKSNTLRYAKAYSNYAKANADDYNLKFKSFSKALFEKAQKYYKLSESLSHSIEQHNILDKLNLALEKGEISVVEYYTELASYYSIRERLLDVQHNYLKTYLQLNWFDY